MDYVIFHDNGVRGCVGFSEEHGDIDEILRQYAAAGIHVESFIKIK